jgi:hypothetical protein
VWAKAGQRWSKATAPQIAIPSAAGYDCILKFLSVAAEGTMSLKSASMFAIFCFIIPVNAIQQTPGMGAQAANSQAGMAHAAENAQIRQMAATHDDAQALRDDIKKMRVLVRQMEANLAFVDTTQSPLKHQFQLEIDMWKTVIDHMERRVQGNAH